MGRTKIDIAAELEKEFGVSDSPNGGSELILPNGKFVAFSGDHSAPIGHVCSLLGLAADVPDNLIKATKAIRKANIVKANAGRTLSYIALPPWLYQPQHAALDTLLRLMKQQGNADVVLSGSRVRKTFQFSEHTPECISDEAAFGRFGHKLSFDGDKAMEWVDLQRKYWLGMPRDAVKTGIFWVPADTTEEMSTPYLRTMSVYCDREGNILEEITEGKAKNGDTFNHKAVWATWGKFERRGVKEYDYYPRGRVEVKHDKAIIYLNPHIKTPEVIKAVVDEFDLYLLKSYTVKVDGSEHYKCHFDRGDDLFRGDDKRSSAELAAMTDIFHFDSRDGNLVTANMRDVIPFPQMLKEMNREAVAAILQETRAFEPDWTKEETVEWLNDLCDKAEETAPTNQLGAMIVVAEECYNKDLHEREFCVFGVVPGADPRIWNRHTWYDYYPFSEHLSNLVWTKPIEQFGIDRVAAEILWEITEYDDPLKRHGSLPF
jgi:hypothetical protein